MSRAGAIVLCEGQGSVVPGKGRDLVEKSAMFAKAFESVQSLTEIDLADISWGPGRFRTKSDPHLAHVYSFAHQYAQFQTLKASGCEFAALTGHSLGELLALVFAGGVPFDQGFAFIDLRGRLFARNVRESNSDMIALIGSSEAVLSGIVSIPDGYRIYVANRNSPSQTVVAVASEDVPFLVSHFQSRGVRAVPLQLGNGCHSPYVDPIQAELEDAIASLEIREPDLPFFSASFGTFLSRPAEIRDALKRHLLAPVEWCSSMQALLSLQVGGFVELGYAKILKAMLLELDRSADIQMFESVAGRGVAVDG